MKSPSNPGYANGVETLTTLAVDPNGGGTVSATPVLALMAEDAQLKNQEDINAGAGS